VTTQFQGRTFDVRPSDDPRNGNYPVQALLAATGTTGKPRSYSWNMSNLVLDQGQEGACVGFAWAAEGHAFPKRVPGISDQVARALYKDAQRLDEWKGEDYSGTSVNAGAKAARARGWIREWRWTKDLEDLAVVVSRFGPAVLDVDWHEGMYGTAEAAPGAYRHAVRVSGRQVGRHAILCNGYNLARDEFSLHNSWGPGWGVKGRAWISRPDLAQALNVTRDRVNQVLQAQRKARRTP
jgi:hypothetical protein